LSCVVESESPAVSGRQQPEICRPQPHRSDAPLRADLRFILHEGAAHSVMLGVGENYLSAFVLAMGMGQIAAGLVTTVPLLAGAVLQLISPAAVDALGSHRRWVVVCAAIQAASFLPMCAGALAGSLPVAAMFALAAVYFGAGMATSPAWNTWVDTIVPSRLRARYFSRRTRVNQIATLAGFVAGGFALQLGLAAGCRLQVFAALFLLAAICRLASTVCLARQSEPEPSLDGHRRIGMREFLGRFRSSGDGRLLVYLLGVQAAAQIAGPYFTSYMLGPMRLSYVAYVALIAVPFAAKAASLPALGSLASRFGTRRLLFVGGVGIVPISGLWLVSDSFAFLICVQVLSGVSWAAYELATFLSFFESIRPEERTSLLTKFNFAHSVATTAGSLLGGGLLLACGKNQQTYLLLFGLSSVARAVTLIGLWRVPRGLRLPAVGRAPRGLRDAARDEPRPIPSGVAVGQALGRAA